MSKLYVSTVHKIGGSKAYCISPVEGIEYGAGTGGTVAYAKEIAAKIALEALEEQYNRRN
jgi:hypothetical protein